MRILLNNKDTPFDGENLTQLLTLAGAAKKRGIAVAVNDEVVPRDHWLEKLLTDGDQVLIIEPTQGG